MARGGICYSKASLECIIPRCIKFNNIFVVLNSNSIFIYFSDFKSFIVFSEESSTSLLCPPGIRRNTCIFIYLKLIFSLINNKYIIKFQKLLNVIFYFLSIYEYKNFKFIMMFNYDKSTHYFIKLFYYQI